MIICRSSDGELDVSGNGLGSGGSIVILAPSVIGSGDIKADGGSSGGSGGRIAIKDLTSEFVFDGSITVDGGSTSAGAGTVTYFCSH